MDVLISPLITLFSGRVIGAPVAQPRPRATVRKKQDGTVRAGAYNDPAHPVNAWRAHVKRSVQYSYTLAYENIVATYGEKTIGYVIELAFFLPGKIGQKLPIVPHIASANDCDNLAKAVIDAIEGFWPNDGQIVGQQISKFAVVGDVPPGVGVKILAGVP